MRNVLVLIAVAGVLLVGCRREPAAPPPGTPIVKVKVTAGGEVSADGQPVTLERLAARMSQLKQVGGAVYYYRENPEGEPHPNAMKVIELVTENQLPIRLCTNPDFSD